MYLAIPNRSQYSRTGPNAVRSTRSTQAPRKKKKLNISSRTKSRLSILCGTRSRFKQNARHFFLVKTESSGSLTIKQKILRSSREYTLADRDVMDLSPKRSFYVLVINFYNPEVQFPKDMKFSRTANPPGAIHAVNSAEKKSQLYRNPESRYYFHCFKRIGP